MSFGLRQILAAVLLLVAFGFSADASKSDIPAGNLAAERARMLRQLDNKDDDLRSLCSGVQKCLDVSLRFCTEEDLKPWPKQKYNQEFCAPYYEIAKRGFALDMNRPMGPEIYARLGRQYRVIYESVGTLPLGPNVISYLFDNMPFTAQLINAYLETEYELEYTHPSRRFFRGSNGRSLSGEFYWALQDSAGTKLGMRNLFFGYGHAQVLKWSLHGTAIAYLDMDPVGPNELKYKLTAIVFPGNSVLNSIMQMRVFRSVVNDKINVIVNDVKKASKMYFGGNKEPMLKSASLKSLENVQYVLDFENVVNGAPWQLGDFVKLQRARAEEQKKKVPIIFDESRKP